ncbi:hypothetical protein DFH07DRAFT_769138 [Mycena maculata]|uniref:Uncharacterized protein n=1 Tax=Mycena maculata TaxID=230809 RepID=A0AAD7NPB1_9AGAR|nr:hypothetical protein DFH07DRAFT_769138 [Mycena maculata]
MCRVATNRGSKQKCRNNINKRMPKECFDLCLEDILWVMDVPAQIESPRRYGAQDKKRLRNGWSVLHPANPMGPPPDWAQKHHQIRRWIGWIWLAPDPSPRHSISFCTPPPPPSTPQFFSPMEFRSCPACGNHLPVKVTVLHPPPTSAVTVPINSPEQPRRKKSRWFDAGKGPPVSGCQMARHLGLETCQGRALNRLSKDTGISQEGWGQLPKFGWSKIQVNIEVYLAIIDHRDPREIDGNWT